MVIVLHLLQILLWATFYRWHCLPTWEFCFYFSAASYSTVGYGDIVLPRLWRSLGPVESVVGVLMSGVSVSALFAIVTRLISSEKHSPTTTKSPYAAIPFATCFRSTDYSVCGLHAAEFVSQTRRRSSPLSRKKWKTDENATFESLNKVYPRLESRGLWSPGLAMRLVGTAAGLVITVLMIMVGADAFGQNDPLVSSTQPALPGGHTPFPMATAQDSIRMGN